MLIGELNRLAWSSEDKLEVSGDSQAHNTKRVTEALGLDKSSWKLKRKCRIKIEKSRSPMTVSSCHRLP